MGYRLYDGKYLKFDALAGIRYWHVGLSNTLEPSGLSSSRSTNWVDGVGGGRFIVPFGEKAALTVAGDAGAGQADPGLSTPGPAELQLDPQVRDGSGLALSV